MRYIDLTNPEDLEPTYNTFQIVAGSILGVASVIVFAIGAISLISSL